MVLMYVRFPLSLRNVEDLLFERGVDVCHETVRMWWNRFGPMFAGDIRRQRVSAMRGFRHWRWHLDEMYVKINGELHYLWRAVDHEGEILESFVTKARDKDAALRFMKKALKRHGSPEAITTDGLRSYGAAMKELGNIDKREVGTLGQQPGGEQPSAVPTTRAGDDQVQADEDAFRSSPRSMPTSTTTSTSNVTSSIAKPTRPAAQPPWPSGNRSWPEIMLSPRQLRQAETSSHPTDSTSCVLLSGMTLPSVSLCVP